MICSAQILSIIITAANALGYAWTLLLNNQASAHTNPTDQVQMVSAKHTYNPQMVRIYNYQCGKQLQKINGESSEQAQQICQCSITKMQQQYSQSQAIQIIAKAQANIKSDPKAMPPELSPFFTPCLSTKE